MYTETSGESIETKTEAVQAIDRKVVMFLIAGKLNEVRTEEIDGYFEEDELEYNLKKSYIYLNVKYVKTFVEALTFCSKPKEEKL